MRPDEKTAGELSHDARLTEPARDLLAQLGAHEKDEQPREDGGDAVRFRCGGRKGGCV